MFLECLLCSKYSSRCLRYISEQNRQSSSSSRGTDNKFYTYIVEKSWASQKNKKSRIKNVRSAEGGASDILCRVFRAGLIWRRHLSRLEGVRRESDTHRGDSPDGGPAFGVCLAPRRNDKKPSVFGAEWARAKRFAMTSFCVLFRAWPTIRSLSLYSLRTPRSGALSGEQYWTP